MTQWLRVSSIDDIPCLGARIVRTDTLDIALFRTTDDKVYAIKDSCPHQGGPLSQGIVHSATVTCPLHNWKIDLDSGQALAPDEGCVHRFPVKVDNGEVFLMLDAEQAVA